MEHGELNVFRDDFVEASRQRSAKELGPPAGILSRERSRFQGHSCRAHATWPKQNAAFWRAKILRNGARDREVNRLLKKAGWRVVRIWEHELTRKNEGRLLAKLRCYGLSGKIPAETAKTVVT